MKNDFSAFFEYMSKAPKREMDPCVLPRFKALAEAQPLKADDVLHVIDDCVHNGLCSDFCIQALDIVWRQLLHGEGRTIEQGFAAATWRGDITGRGVL
jgi:hypothetical protein